MALCAPAIGSGHSSHTTSKTQGWGRGTPCLTFDHRRDGVLLVGTRMGRGGDHGMGMDCQVELEA